MDALPEGDSRACYFCKNFTEEIQRTFDDFIHVRSCNDLKKCSINHPVITTIAASLLALVGSIFLIINATSTILALKNKSFFHLSVSLLSFAPLLISLILLTGIVISVLSRKEFFIENLKNQAALLPKENGLATYMAGLNLSKTPIVKVAKKIIDAVAAD